MCKQPFKKLNYYYGTFNKKLFINCAYFNFTTCAIVLMDKLDNCVRSTIHVEQWGIGIKAHSVKLVAVLHREFGKVLKVFFRNGLYKIR